MLEAYRLHRVDQPPVLTPGIPETAQVTARTVGACGGIIRPEELDTIRVA